MKHVFSNSADCIHVWAQQGQDNGRCANVFFQGKDVYSYGYHFKLARFIDLNTVLIATKSYSVTTAKHQVEVRYATNHKNRLYIYDVDRADESIQAAQSTVNQLLKKASVAVSKQADYLNAAKHLVETTTNTIKAAKMPHDKKALNALKRSVEKIELTKIKVVVKKENAEKLAAKKARQIEEAKYTQEKLNEWLNNTRDYAPRVDRVFLRIKNDEVQTSKGARVPLTEAKTIYSMIKRGKAIHGLTIGNYTITSLNDGILKIGCHAIEMTEADRVLENL